jgi:hypothetical protein
MDNTATPSKRAGWKNALLYALVACVSVAVLLAVAGAGAFLWATSVADDLGAPAQVPAALRVAMPSMTAGASVGVAADPPRLEIELQDGQFEVVAGPPGSDVQVDGEYASNYYELVEEHGGADGTSGSVTAIRLRPTSGILVRMIALVRGSDNRSSEPNRLTVSIPTARPIALMLNVSAGESRIDLGGLSLTDLDAELTMGDHRLDFGRPLAGELRQLRISGRMGNIELHHLGNARARELRASSRMGNFTVDLSGAWRDDAVSDLVLNHSMGDLRLRIPSSVRISPDSENAAMFGESGRIDRTRETADDSAPVLRLSLSTTMGETRIRRYDTDEPVDGLAAVVPAPVR